ncbi:MAG: S41 family peptidase [bacterium]
MKKVLILLACIGSFVAGGAVAYFAVKPVLERKREAVNSFQFIPRKLAQNQSPKLEKMIPKTPPAPQPVVLRSDEAAEAADLLQSNFFDAPFLAGASINASNVQEMVGKLGARVRLGDGPTPLPSEFLAIKPELIFEGVGYWRVASFSEQGILRLIEAWYHWRAGGLKGLVIDLRDFQAMNDYGGGADFAGLLTSPNTPLFSMQGVKFSQKVFYSARQPLEGLDKLPVIVLINGNTRGAGEVLADLLRRYAKAILVGQPTAGESALYTETKLKSGRFLRRATAVVVTSGGETLLGRSVEPDIWIEEDAAVQSLALKRGYEQGMASVVKEAPKRKQLNEASLVQEGGAELEAWVDSQQQSVKDVLEDSTLRHALDIIQGVALVFPSR